MARPFTMVSTSISGSRKLRSVDSHGAKYLYLMILASPLASFCGLFRYPLGVAAYDAQLSHSETEAAISLLKDAGLIAFEPDDEVVQVVNWFSVNAPTNADHALRLTREFGKLDIGSEQMRCATFTEFLIATLSAVPRWKPEKVENLLNELRPLISRMESTHGDVFLEAVLEEIPRSQAFVRKEAEVLVVGLAAFQRRRGTLSTPCPQGGHTQDLNNTNTETNTETSLDALSETPESVSALPQVQSSEVLRNGEEPRCGADVLPLEATKRSALAMGVN